MGISKYFEDQRLIADVIAGDNDALSRFLDLAESSIWPAVVALAGDGQAADDAFINIIKELQSNSFSRLGRYDGRSRLSTYLTLLARDILGEEIARAFGLASDPDRVWRRFDRLIGRDIRERIRLRFPRANEARRKDLYQDVVLKLIDQNYRRIRAFAGHGSFSGYVLRVVDRLLIDELRAPNESGGRRRLPAEIECLSPLHRAVFQAAAWNGVACDPDIMALAVGSQIKPEPKREDLVIALGELAGAIAKERVKVKKVEEISLDAGDGLIETPEFSDPSATAEELLVQKEDQLEIDTFLDVVRRKTETLPNLERFYIQLLWSASEPLPPREIARKLTIPVEEVYQLRQRTCRWMKQIALDLKKATDLSV